MARDTRGESHDRHIRPNTGPPLTGGGSGINDNNTSRNQICCLGLVLLGNSVSNDTGEEGNVGGVTHTNGSDKDLIFLNEFSGQDDLIRVTSDSRKDKNISIDSENILSHKNS